MFGKRRKKKKRKDEEKKQWAMIGRGWTNDDHDTPLFSLDLERCSEVAEAYIDAVSDNGYMRVYCFENNKDGDHDYNLCVALPEGTIDFGGDSRNDTGSSRSRRQRREQGEEQERKHQERSSKGLPDYKSDDEVPY